MDGIDLMASAMQAMKLRLDVAAGNLANASSDGFRRSVAHVVLGARGLTTTTAPDASAGALKHTGRSFDLAVAGRGGFMVRAAAGKTEAVTTASFVRDASGHLLDGRGRMLLGEGGPLRVASDATIDDRGVVRAAGVVTGRVRLPAGASLQRGFLVASNVDAVREMVDVLEAQRAFETAQKSVTALDDARSKAANELARVRA